MDRVIYVLFSMLVFISLVTSIGSVLFTGQSETVQQWWYLRLLDNIDESFNPKSTLSSGLLQFLRALILYGYLIPISLYVSIEVVKLLQAMLINKDMQMYDETTDKSVVARTSNLNEELGQVEMILSDKTGTLTCNQMEFKKCLIEGISYGGDINEVDLAASQRMNIDVERYRFSLDGSDSSTCRSVEMHEISSGIAEKAVLDGDEDVQNLDAAGKAGISVSKGFNFRDDRLMNKLWIYGSNVWNVVMFFRVMALCHTGIPLENDQTDNSNTNKLRYEAESVGP